MRVAHGFIPAFVRRKKIRTTQPEERCQSFVRVLILSGNTGEGHNSCAKAIKQVFDAKCESCVIEDALRFISDRASGIISWGHTCIYRNFPWLFNFGYSFSSKHTGVFKQKNMLYNFFGKGAENLYRFIVDGNYDTVISVHPFSALMLTEVKKRYSLSAKTAFVATDYTCSPSVKDSDLDYYFIPNEAFTDNFVCDHIPVDTIIPSGIPIRQMFYAHVEKETAKQELGIPSDHKHIVIMCGSMGCGPIKTLVKQLLANLDETVELTVICGRNKKLKSQLERRHKTCSHLRVFGYVDDISSLLDSADLYLTKAGGISVTEAAVKKLPMLFINAVAGCEAYNSAFFAERGCAVKSDSSRELVANCTALIEDRTQYDKIVAAFDTLAMRNAAECIYDTLNGDAD